MSAIPAKAICLAILLLGQPLLAPKAVADEPGSKAADAVATEAPWRFSIRPYFFLSGLSGSVTASRVTLPINASFGDLVDNLRPSGFAAFTVEKGPWGLYADLQYISLAGEGSRDVDARLSLRNVISELDVTFRPPTARTLKFFVGARLYAIDQTLTVGNLPEAKASTVVVDPVLGAVGDWSLSDAWRFEVRGDIGGFGVGSELTYQMMALFSVGLSQTFAIPFGYRVLGYKVDTGGVSMNVLMSGLVVGLDIRL